MEVYVYILKLQILPVHVGDSDMVYRVYSYQKDETAALCPGCCFPNTVSHAQMVNISGRNERSSTYVKAV